MLFIMHLDNMKIMKWHLKNLSQIDLWAAFAQFGEIEDAYVIRDLDTNNYLKFGFVLFKALEGSRRAKEAKKIEYGKFKIAISKFKKMGQDINNYALPKAKKASMRKKGFFNQTLENNYALKSSQL